LISYWNSGEEYISLTVIKDGEAFELFNAREISHLKDVKALFWLDYRVLLGTLVYSLGYTLTCLLWRRRRYWRRLAWDVAGGSAIALGLMLVTALGALLGEEQFARFWFQFHIFSFANDLWLLDPSKDYLVMLVPQGFWFDAVRFVLLTTAGMAAVLGGAAAGHLLFNRDRRKE
ncbi:MAG: DUF1461 domain-containing protein, partial [Chloroflexi bacterium]|nr:DUF1461 domain-containing protein [Chloroflexota bacterium]